MNYLKAIILSAIVSGVLFFFYSKYFMHSKNQDIVLSEEHEEHKRKPVEAGGIVIAHSSSLIYEKLNPGSVVLSKVNVLPDSEKPIELDFKSNPKNMPEYDSIDDILAKIELQAEEESPQKEAVTPDNVVMPNSIDSSDELLHEQDATEPSNPLTENGLRITNLPEETNKLYNLNINSIDSGYKIQLSSAWSEKEAQNEWKKIQARHVKYLKNAELVIKKVKANNDKIIYLIMAGHYSSVAQAKLICKKLTQAKQNCIVTK